MLTYALTEYALRSAVNTTQQSGVKVEDQLAKIKIGATEKVQSLVSASSNVNNQASQMDVQAIAINLAMQTIELSYSAIKEHAHEMKEKRISFDKERRAGIATFMIRNNKEEKDLSTEMNIVKNFMTLIERDVKIAEIKTYFGIQKNTLIEEPNSDFYSILPFYRMSETIAQPVASNSSLDKQRVAINLFFKVIVPDTMAQINERFQHQHSIPQFFVSMYKSDNYLNDLRLSRFLNIALANLLWNLQHPVDPNTGFSLSVDSSIKLCRDVSQFLNKFLTTNDDNCLKDLKIRSFVNKIETHVKALYAAFVEEQLNQLNIIDLVNNAHDNLRVMDKSIFELLFSEENGPNKEKLPDEKAAETLAYSISYLNQLLTNRPELFFAFNPLAKRVGKAPFINIPPLNIIDVLSIFIHSTHNQKAAIFKKLMEDKTDTAYEFRKTLEKFKNHFVQPIKAKNRKILGSRIFDEKSKEVALKTAQTLIPLITLVVEDFRIEIDNPASVALIKKAAATPFAEKKYSAKEQAALINQHASNKTGYYNWIISPFIDAQLNAKVELDTLPHHQYRFTQITKLLDAVGELVQNYRSLLQSENFQQFLIKCLDKISAEYDALRKKLLLVDSLLTKDSSMSRKMQDILSNMTENLNNNVHSFKSAFSSFASIISAPDFTEHQKNSLSNKINDIHLQFSALFAEDSGITPFISGPKTEQAPISTEPKPYNEPETQKMRVQGSDLTKPEQKIEATSKNLVELVPLPPPEKPIASAQRPYPEESMLKKLTLSQVETKTIDSSLVSIRTCAALRYFIMQCNHALSLQSKLGEKGKLLANLLNKVEQTQMSEKQLHEAIRELARISLTYRQSYFFQASYGESRSAKAFIAGIKDPRLNTQLPLAEALFGESIDFDEESAEVLAQRLRVLRRNKTWQESCSEMHLALQW